MTTTFAALEPEYVRLMAIMKITRLSECQETAKRLVANIAPYKQAQDKFGVPAIWLACVGEREDGANILHSYFGNGDPLDKPTKDVPRNRGPFQTFEAGLEDALQYDHIPMPGVTWTWPLFAYKGEAWNGFGPRNKGKHSGYLWAGTNIYTGGKYIRDNVWDPTTVDEQLGIIPVARCMVEIDPTLDIPGWPGTIAVPPPMAVPEGVHNPESLQKALNEIMDTQLAVDGNYGRRTAAAVRAFQRILGLPVDGIAGPDTWKAIDAQLARLAARP